MANLTLGPSAEVRGFSAWLAVEVTIIEDDDQAEGRREGGEDREGGGGRSGAGGAGEGGGVTIPVGAEWVGEWERNDPSLPFYTRHFRGLERVSDGISVQMIGEQDATGDDVERFIKLSDGGATVWFDSPEAAARAARHILAAADEWRGSTT